MLVALTQGSPIVVVGDRKYAVRVGLVRDTDASDPEQYAVTAFAVNETGHVALSQLFPSVEDARHAEIHGFEIEDNDPQVAEIVAELILIGAAHEIA